MLFILLLLIHNSYGFNFFRINKNSIINLKLKNTDYKYINGRLLFPGMNGKKSWDTDVVSYPVVLPPNKNNKKWLMYYYGFDGKNFNRNLTSVKKLQIGSNGFMESKDGLVWNKNTEIIKSNSSEFSYDNVQIGISDVLYDNNNYIMHYFGACEEKILGYYGLRMRCLVAKSNNNINWYKYKVPTINIGKENEWDHIFTTFPRITKIEPDNSKSKWLITYHSAKLINNEAYFYIGGIISNNKYGLGKKYKLGIILKPGNKGSWDDGGVGIRHIIHFNNIMYMLYEGKKINEECYAIGLAYSINNGITWIKIHKGTGGPIFEPRFNKDAWDNYSVRSPYIVKTNDNKILMYYVGYGINKNGGQTTAIGCAKCINLNLTMWARV